MKKSALISSPFFQFLILKNIAMLIGTTLFFVMSFNVAAQRGSGGWCAKNNYSKMFNPNTIEDFKGTVTGIEKMTPETGMSAGIHLVTKTEKNENLSVHLGPAWYLDNQDVHFAIGDAIKVKGSRITYQNAPAIIAMTVEKGDQVLLLRDKKGNPNWNGWRQGKGKQHGKQ